MPNRRALLTTAAALAGTAWTMRSGLAALVPTPRQSRGPFYPVEIPLDSDNDLVSVAGRAKQAAGGSPINPAGRWPAPWSKSGSAMPPAAIIIPVTAAAPQTRISRAMAA